MSKQLYEEALADVKKLKEVAEDNAKKALIEAVTPRIRDLIENQLLREYEESEGVGGKVGDDGELLLDDELSDESNFVPSPPAEPTTAPSMVVGAMDLTGGWTGDVDVASAISMPDEKGEVVLDLDALSQAAGVEPSQASDEAAPIVASEMLESANLDVSTGLRILKLENKVNSLSRYKSNLRKMSGFRNLVAEAKEEVETIYGGIQESNLGTRSKKLFEAKLETIYGNVNKLMEPNMKRINEADITLKLTGVPDDMDLEDLGVELADMGEEEGEEEEGGEEELDLGGDEGEKDEDEEVELDLGGEDEGEEEDEDDDMEEAKLPMESANESRRNDDNVIVEIDENMLRREIKRMRALREAAEDVQKWGHGAGDVSDEFEDDDLGDPFLDGEVTTESLEEMDVAEAEEDEDLKELMQAHGKEEEEEDELAEYGMNELEQGYDEDSKTAKGGKQPRTPGQPEPKPTQKETLERRLRHEAQIQLEAKKKAHKAKKMKEQQTKKGMQAADDAKRAAKKGDKHGAVKKQKEARSCQKEALQLGEAYTYYATKFNESVSRTKRLQAVLAEVRRNEGTANGSSTRLAESADKLRDKLAETNLFNAKLLYSNKLLQNESLTKRQKAEVIQRLDEAKNEREVKLVYESLVKTLSGASRLSEVAERRVLGSSSQATRPASTLMNEGVELNRWAKLAGIK